MAIAYDDKGHEVAHASDTLDGKIPRDSYEAALTLGFAAQQTLALKPGSYTLRLGVMDRVSQQLGTLAVPVQIP